MMIGNYWSGEEVKAQDGRRNATTGTRIVEILGSKPAHLRAKGAAPGAGMKASATFLLHLLLAMVPWSPAAHAQEMNKPVMTVDDEVTAFAYALDGRIAYSVRHLYKAKRYDMERDDIFMLEPGGKRRKIFSGEKFSTGDKPITYLIEGFTWSPNSKILAVQMNTIAIDIQDGRTDEPQRALLFLDDSGREIRPVTKGVLQDAENPLWLRDNSTLVYMSDDALARSLFSMHYINLFSGPAGKAFEGRTFAAAVRMSGSNAAIAVERDRNMDGPPRLQLLDLLAQDDKEIATLDAFAGGLSISPSGTLAAYYLDNEVLEIRDLSAPKRVARLRIGLGVLQWSADEKKIYLKRTIEKKSADLVSFTVPPLISYANRAEVPVSEPTPEYLLHGLTVREYAVSPDGRFIGIVLPGKRNLQIFAMK
jgi:dipeptidyl aminopeptidase/acylaminoacyl peptidase